MKKKIVILIVALGILFAGSATILGTTIVKTIKKNENDATLKTENEKNYIAEMFHDQGHIYMSPQEPKEGEELTLRLRTVRYNVTRAQVQYTNDNGVSWKTVNMEYEKQDDTGYYDLWKASFKAEGSRIYYRFLAGNKDVINVAYYDTKGVSQSEGSYRNCWQVVPGHEVPEWTKGATWYSLVPDAFYNGSTTNDKQVSGQNSYATWNNLHKGLRDKYGGDLDGVEKQLDYIQKLNVDAIFMNPIWKSYQNVGYGTLHFDEVESSLGNEEDLVELADAIHKRDMKIMGDVVLTFTNENSYYFDKYGLWPEDGAYEAKDSKWASMYKMFNFPNNYMVTWSSPALDLNDELAKDLIYKKENSYLLKYANILDGYRFDCGGWLWGTTETDDLKAYDIIKDIRKSVKEVNNDFCLLTESDSANLNTNTWDSSWNIHYMDKLQDYAKGLVNETLMTEAMYEYEQLLPRNVALAMQNMLCDHDSYRIVQDKDYMYNAAVLIQMTYLGAPSIFYGEEVNYIRETEDGIGTITSFYAMDWDESNWDQERYNFYRAVTELRKEYSCIKTGAANVLNSDNSNNTICFGRWDENGAAITVTSQNEDVIKVEIDAKQCDIPDGTVMTDWFAGVQYVVEDGKFTAEVIPGGTVFVTGKKAATFRHAYEVTEIGTNLSKDGVFATNTSSFLVEGEGKIDGSSDNLMFANVVAYDAFSVYANVRGEDKGSLLIRDGLNKKDVFYGAYIDGEKLQIIARTAIGKQSIVIKELDCTKNTYVKLSRNANNEFVAYKTEVTDGKLGKWELIKGSEILINMNNRVYYGFAPLKGKMRVNNITFTQEKGESTFDTFDEKVVTSLFENINADFVSVKDGSLVIKNNKQKQSHRLVTNGREDDWTFKTKMKHTPTEDGYAGVVSQQDDKNYIIAGVRHVKDEEVFFIGKATNGKIVIYNSVKNLEPDKEVVIQLQRIGAYYSAIYSSDNEASWNYIGKVYTNYSEENVGLLVAGKGSAAFDWVSFGDSINDGISTNTPHTPIEVDVTYTNNSMTSDPSYEWVNGEWSLVTGGWNQSNKTTLAQASIVNRLFTDLYAEATIEIKDGNGWAGFGFGKQTPYTEDKDGFALRYYKNGTLELTYQGEVISERKLDSKSKSGMRIVVEAFDGTIIVYAGQDTKPIMTVYGTGYYNGYTSLYTSGVNADFRNFHHGSTGASWNIISGTISGSGNVLSTIDTSTKERQIHSAAALAGYAFTDFVATAKLGVMIQDEELAAAAGLLLCASEGKSSSVDGAYVHVDGKGNLILSIDGQVKSTYALPANAYTASIMVVKQEGTYKVFYKGVDEPVMEYTEDFNRGGVLAVHTINGGGIFANIGIENLQSGQDYTQTKTAKEWKNSGTMPFQDNFANTDSAEHYLFFNTESAKFDVKDGSLQCTDPTAWVGGATILKDSYSDFTLEFKLRMDAKAGSWMSVGMRKTKVDGNHTNSGMSMMINPSGALFFYSSIDDTSTEKAQIPDFRIGQWYNVKIEARGKMVTAYVNGQKLLSYTDNDFQEGFINFTSGKSEFSLDDIKVTPLK